MRFHLLMNAPMKYSLRSLMIGVTLFCVLLGARVEYLRRWATYHECETEKYARSIELEQHLPHKLLDSQEYWAVGPGVVSMLQTEKHGPPISVVVTPEFKQMQHHRSVAPLFRHAIYRPWMAVDETLVLPGYRRIPSL